MPQKPLAFGPSLQYEGGKVTKDTLLESGSRSQEDGVSERYCGLIWWTVVWYNLTVTGVVLVDVISSCFLGDFCCYGNIPTWPFKFQQAVPLLRI